MWAGEASASLKIRNSELELQLKDWPSTCCIELLELVKLMLLHASVRALASPESRRKQIQIL